ncbi:MAG: hypothetical protein V3T32_04125 [Thermodesulfobacteriota bacterium]
MRDKSAEEIFEEGKKYNLRQSTSPSSATTARVFFQQAVTMGHTGAMRDLAHMCFDGRGGTKDKEEAIWLLWAAFHRGDYDSLDELTDILESYSEEPDSKLAAADALKASKNAATIKQNIDSLMSFIHQVAQVKTDNAL